MYWLSIQIYASHIIWINALYPCIHAHARMAVLDNVHAEDQVIVRNVVAAIEALKQDKILLSWTVDSSNGYYTLNAFINDAADFEFSKTELDTICL